MAKYLFDGCKLKWFMPRIEEHFKYGKRIYPLHIDIGVTKVCNAKCIYCYGMKQVMTGSIIPRKQLLDIFGTASKLGIKSITITGDGEPTLNKDVYDAIILGKKNGLDIGFATNGILINDIQLDILLMNCTWIRFNLSAHDIDSYIKIHGVDKWNVVSQTIARAVQRKKELGVGVTLGLQMVLVPDALPSVLPEAKWGIKTGVDYFVIKQFSDPGCAEMSRFDMNLYDSSKVLDILTQAEALSTDTTKIVPKWGMIKDKGRRHYGRCVDCALLFQISGSGKCYPCGYLFGDDRYCYGSLHEHTLKEILDSEQYWGVVKYMREHFDVHKDCKGACRHDFTNTFVWDYLNPPDHINFI